MDFISYIVSGGERKEKSEKMAQTKLFQTPSRYCWYFPLRKMTMLFVLFE